MQQPPLPKNESQRLNALRELEIVDTSPEETFDEITELVCRLLHVPIAAITLVDADQLWFKSVQGLELGPVARNNSICAHALTSEGPLVVPDTRLDERFASNPAVMGVPHIHFYAGEQIVDEDGHVLGALCAMDYKPRTLTVDQLKTLKLLARNAYNQMKLRKDIIFLQRINSVFGRLHARAFSILDKSRYEVAEVKVVEDGVKYLMKNKSVIRVSGPGGHSAFKEKFEKALMQDGPVEFYHDQMMLTIEVVQRGRHGKCVFSMLARVA